jgi:serine/threonine-protein kinase RIO1
MHAMSKRKAELLLMQVLLIARAMFLRCNLVHADLSQFNILVLDGRCHVLDVGQAVDVSHPRAMDFLLADMHNVLVFFRTHSIGTGLVADQVAEWVSQGVVAGPREGEAAGAGREDEEGPWAEFAASSLGDWADVRLAARIGQVLDVC